MREGLESSLLLFINSNSPPQSISRPSATSARLFGLAKDGVIKLFVPRIVKDEVRTRLLAGTQKTIKTILDALRALERDPLSERIELKDLIGVMLDKLNAAAADLNSMSGNHMGDLLRKLNGRIVGQQDPVADRVFEAYFRGHSPFARAKERDHLPDAFVFFSIQVYAKRECRDICIVTNDEKLTSAFQKAEYLVLFKSVDDFLGSDQLSAALVGVQAEKDWLRRLPAVRRWLLRYEEEVTDEIGRSVERFVHENETIEDNRLPSYNSTARITNLSIKTIKVDYNSPRSYGLGRIGLSLNVKE